MASLHLGAEESTQLADEAGVMTEILCHRMTEYDQDDKDVVQVRRRPLPFLCRISLMQRTTSVSVLTEVPQSGGIQMAHVPACLRLMTTNNATLLNLFTEERN